METAIISAMTFPISDCGVPACTKEMICTEKIVEQTITRKQHTVSTR